MNKFLTSSLLLLVSCFAYATPSYWASAYTGAAAPDKSALAQGDCYSGYFCTVETAQKLFGQSSAVDLTDYFVHNFGTAMETVNDNVAAYPSGANAALSKFVTVGVNETMGLYELTSVYGDPLLGSAYLAVLLYENGTDLYVRAMDSDAVFLSAEKDALFETSATSTDWTKVVGADASVPEPTSALLLLLGVAGLALKRHRA